MKNVEKTRVSERNVSFNTGDSVAVSFTIREGNKTRSQVFQGTVIQKNGSGLGRTFTVRKASGNNVFVERVFPYHSPLITEIKIIRKGKVRRAKLFYLRKRTGKATRIEEKK
jgi:large subunit ribosomal protein L19